MVFDNNPKPTPSLAAQVAGHLPLLLIAGGLTVAFLSLHAALITVAGLAALHIVVGLVLIVFQRRGNGARP